MRKLILYFLIVTSLVLLSSVYLPVPFRNYTPVVYPLITFVPFWALLLTSHTHFNAYFIDNHLDFIHAHKIEYTHTKFKKSIYWTYITENESKFIQINKSYGSKIAEMKLLFKLVILSFVFSACIGVLTVVQTWN